MSQQAPNWFVQEYRSNVRNIYQSEGYALKQTVTPEGRIEGKTAYFPVAGKMKAKAIDRNTGNAVPQNPDRSYPSVDLSDWQVFSEINFLDLNKMTVNERDVQQREGAMALGRKSDRIIIDAMGASFPGSQTTGTGADITLADVMTASKELFARGAPDDGNVFCLLPYLWFSVLSTYKQFNNADWVGFDQLGFPKRVRGKFWNGVHYILAAESADDADESLFTVPASNQLYSYMWHRNSIGAVSNYDGQTFVAWDNRATVWTINMLGQGAAKRILDKGVQRLKFASNTTISATA